MSGRDRDKGFLHDAFEETLRRAGSIAKRPEFDDFASAEDVRQAVADGDLNCKDDCKTEIWPRQPGSSDTGDPRGHLVKPTATSKWTHPPATDEEKALYHGVHMHTESNPLGLHTHNPGGKLSGGHSHGPQNRFGVHHHKSEKPLYGVNLDGAHTHEGRNHPDGCHDHIPENFG